MLHSMLINQSGGIDGIRDNGLLDSALNMPLQSFNNEDFIHRYRVKQLDYVIAL